MKKKQQALPLVGLVIAIPSGISLAPRPTQTHRNVGGSSTSLAGSTNHQASRRAFLATASSAVVGTSFISPANAVSKTFRPQWNFGYVKRNGKWRRIGGGDDSSDSDGESSIGTSDDESSVSSNEGKQENTKVAMNVDIPTKLAYNGVAG